MDAKIARRSASRRRHEYDIAAGDLAHGPRAHAERPERGREEPDAARDDPHLGHEAREQIENEGERVAAEVPPDEGDVLGDLEAGREAVEKGEASERGREVDHEDHHQEEGHRVQAHDQDGQEPVRGVRGTARRVGEAGQPATHQADEAAEPRRKDAHRDEVQEVEAEGAKAVAEEDSQVLPLREGTRLAPHHSAHDVHAVSRHEDRAHDQRRQEHEHAADQDLLHPVRVLEEEAEALAEVEIADRRRGRHGVLLWRSVPTLRGCASAVNWRDKTLASSGVLMYNIKIRDLNAYYKMQN